MPTHRCSLSPSVTAVAITDPGRSRVDNEGAATTHACIGARKCIYRHIMGTGKCASCRCIYILRKDINTIDVNPHEGQSYTYSHHVRIYVDCSTVDTLLYVCLPTSTSCEYRLCPCTMIISLIRPVTNRWPSYTVNVDGRVRVQVDSSITVGYGYECEYGFAE